MDHCRAVLEKEDSPSISGWPLGLEPVHLRKRVLDTLVDDPSSNGLRTNPKISTTSGSDDTSNLETESSCSSKFFPDDKPVTLGEILGMSLNHLATNSFRSIELERSSSLPKSRSSWSLMMRCKCTRASTSSSRFDDAEAAAMPASRIYTNSIFEEDEEDQTALQGRPTGSLLDHFRRSATTENPLYLLDAT